MSKRNLQVFDEDGRVFVSTRTSSGAQRVRTRLGTTVTQAIRAFVDVAIPGSLHDAGTARIALIRTQLRKAGLLD